MVESIEHDSLSVNTENTQNIASLFAEGKTFDENGKTNRAFISNHEVTVKMKKVTPEIFIKYL